MRSEAEPPSGGRLTADAQEIDEFLARAVDRQVAEQRALREQLAALTEAVSALASQRSLDPDDLSDRMLAATRSAIDPVITDVRVLGDTVTSSLERVTAVQPEAPPAPVGNSHEVIAAVNAVSADIEGIAQALIDLNAGLRDWAQGVDQSITSIREAVGQVRDFSARTYEHQGVGVRTGEDTGPEDAGPVTSADIEQRMKETVELSLYLADQIEEFDRVLGQMGDLPQRLDGVVAQAMRRTLAARSKLDTETSEAMEDTLASLDEYLDKMSVTVKRFGDSEETLRKLGMGQAELATRLDSLFDAVHDLAEGRAGRAASMTKPKAARAKPAAKSKAKPKTTKRKKAAPSPDDTAAD